MIISLLMSTSMIMSIMFTQLNHPLSMGLTLLMQTLCMTMISGYMNLSFWFSYIMFIVMVGGMLVLFIYMTSIASNEKFMFSKTTFSSMMITSLATSLIWAENFTTTMKINNPESTNVYSQDMLYTTMSKYFMEKSMPIMMTVILFLLIALIAVVKITNVKYGALRQKL
uniref:NADH-ubiquinone oxidoreductase chain 6 n=1 Tax=Dermestidae sp. GENSP01 TaxID=1205804 RepID=A0A0S2MRU8_9COLE|nr:NADH deshydrogenase subunit 6 [Dermestidae sp. GENSP01]